MAKEKDTLSIINEINKKYGDGSIIKLGDKKVQDVAAFSTGVLGLDACLGIKGFPKGRVTEVIGQTGTGKCLTKDSYVLTATNGYQTIEEIFNSCGLETFTVNKEVEQSYPMINRYGAVENTAWFTYNGKRRIVKIETYSGFSIKSTTNHPHLVLSENGFLVWKNSSDIVEGDYLCHYRNGAFGAKSVDLEEAYLLGTVIADGTLCEQSIKITNDDDFIKNLIETRFGKIFGFDGYKKYENNDKGSFNYHFSNKVATTKFYETYGLSATTSPYKYVSSFIRSFDEDSLRAFLRGFIECEGYFGQSLEITSASYELIYQIKLLLSQFGVTATLNNKIASNYPNNNYYRLCISGDSYLTYINNIGFSSPIKKEQAEKNAPNVGTGRSTDTVPYLSKIINDIYSCMKGTASASAILDPYRKEKASPSYSSLKRIVKFADDSIYFKSLLDELISANYMFDEVVSKEYLEELEPTFDFNMPYTNSFIANGLVTHNTSLCLSATADAQKKGEKVAFIDMEHALETKNAISLGVDIDELFVSQPLSGNEGLAIAKLLIESGEFGMVIVDSVAALLPEQEEAQEDFGNSNVGAHARLMAQACRKLTPLASKHNVALVFINQFRTNIAAVGYQDNQVPTGGKSLQFFASTRIELKRINQIKDKTTENVVGHYMKAKILKNKCFKPFLEYQYPVYYGVGSVQIDEISELAVEYGHVKKSGAWLYYKDLKWNGNAQFRSYLFENPALVSELKPIIEADLKKYITDGEKREKRKAVDSDEESL